MKYIFLLIMHFVIAQSTKLKPTPNCESCKWFIHYINDYRKCKMFIEKSDNNKKEAFSFPIYKFAKDCRKAESLCGKYGKLYEKIEIKDEDEKNKLERLKDIDKMLYEYNQFIKNKLN